MARKENTIQATQVLKQSDTTYSLWARSSEQLFIGEVYKKLHQKNVTKNCEKSGRAIGS